MKRFEIHEKKDGYVVFEASLGGYGEVRDFLWSLKECNEDRLVDYYLAGKLVDWQTMLDACAEESEKYWEKKRETHVDNNTVETKMKTMTIEQFEKLVESKEWVREQDYETIERMTVEVETGFDDEKAEFVKDDITRVWGGVTLTSTLGEMVITYNEGWSFDDHDKYGTLDRGTEGQSVVWEIDGVTIVDEDGDELSISDIADFIPWHFKDLKYDFIEFV